MIDGAWALRCAGTGALWRLLYARTMRYARPQLQFPGFASRFVSAVHCCVIVPCACLFLAGWISEPTWLTCITATIGYLIHDLELVLFEPTLHKAEDVVHHISFLTILAFASNYPHQLARGIFAEAALPPLYCSYTIIKLRRTREYRKTFWAASVVGVLFFFVFRVLNFTLLMCQAIYENNIPETTAGAVLSILNYVWFAKLLQKARQPAVSVD